MKKTISILCLILSGMITLAQDKCPIIQGYAYQRTVLPGMIPKGVVDEQGREVKHAPTRKITRYFFLELKRNEEVNITRIWIKGEATAYSVETELLKQAPFIIAKNNIGSLKRADTLVKETENPVLRLHVREPLQSETGRRSSRKSSSSDLLIEYTWKEQKCYYKIDSIKILEPLALQ